MKQQEVKLSLKQVQRDETLRAVPEGRLTVGAAALALGLSRRQVQRLLRRVEAQGPAGVIHGNQGRPPANAYAPATRDQVLELVATEYGGFNCSHLADILAERHRLAVSAETLRRWLRPLGRGAPPRRRRKGRIREGELLFLDGVIYQLKQTPHRDHLVRANLEVQKWFNGQIHFFHPSLGEVSAKPFSANETKNP